MLTRFARRFEAKTSLRVSLHLMITTFRNVALGIVLIWGGDNLLADAFHQTFDGVDPVYLGVILTGAGVLGVAGWLLQRTLLARVSILVADIVLILCLASELVTIFQGNEVAVWLPVLLGSAVAHDFVLVDSPFVESPCDHHTHWDEV